MSPTRDFDPPLGETVECRVCGREVGKGPGGLGIIQHSKRHRREFRERFGREPEDYEEVRRVLGRGEWPDDRDPPTGPDGYELLDARLPFIPLSRFLDGEGGDGE